MEAKRTHLANWKSFCQLKDEGGLGLRGMHYMNQAFIMKLGWGIINDTNSLWTSVLCNKYVRTNANIPQMQAKQRDSPLWKAICKEWFHVIKGISWAIGNGENASSSKMSGWMSLAL